MAVLTQKELAEKKAAAIQKGLSLKPAAASILKEKKADAEKQDNDSKKTRWHLLHPERELNNNIDFEDVIKVNGIEYERICVNGRIVTEEPDLAEYLQDKGWVLIKQEEIINGKVESIQY